jgi:hypothetical protein
VLAGGQEKSPLLLSKGFFVYDLKMAKLQEDSAN